jgi:hypothetical protein
VWAWVLCGYKQRVCEEKVKLEEIDDQGKFPFSLCFGFSVDSFFLCKLYCIVDPIGNHADSEILHAAAYYSLTHVFLLEFSSYQNLFCRMTSYKFARPDLSHDIFRGQQNL